jgi:hypothetical protein
MKCVSLYGTTFKVFPAASLDTRTQPQQNMVLLVVRVITSLSSFYDAQDAAAACKKDAKGKGCFTGELMSLDISGESVIATRPKFSPCRAVWFVLLAGAQTPSVYERAIC